MDVRKRITGGTGTRRRIVCAVLAAAMAAGQPAAAWATSSRQQMEQDRDKAQQGLNEANEDAREAEANRNQAQGVVSGLTAELTDLLTELDLLEEDIAAKEIQIQEAQEAFDAAKAKEQEQYEAMKKRIKYMYEKGDTEFLDVLLKVRSMSELLNKSEYIENIYRYDRQKLLEYQETKRQVEEYQIQLDNEMNEMEGMKLEYEEQQAGLEATIAQKRREIADFDAQLAQAKANAEAYKKTIAQKNEQIRKAEEEERRRQEEERRRQEEEARKRQEEESRAAAAAQQNSSSSGSKPSASSSGSSDSVGPGGSAPSSAKSSGTSVKSSGGTAAGREIADYGLQFVGNPYVYGGTSLTNGTDCSGFTQSIYKHFGYTIPRTSAEQRSAGYAVDYSEAQPGDLICYPGHVGLYIGNGQIVHASNAKNGIMVSSATYRSIMAVRRILP